MDVMEKHLEKETVERRLGRLQLSITEGAIATVIQVEEYEKIARDVDAAIKAGIAASSHPNVGLHRSLDITDAAAIVRYWRLQLTAYRNNIGLSEKIVRFATKQDLPTEVVPLGIITQPLHEAWEDLHIV